MFFITEIPEEEARLFSENLDKWNDMTEDEVSLVYRCSVYNAETVLSVKCFPTPPPFVSEIASTFNGKIRKGNMNSSIEGR